MSLPRGVLNKPPLPATRPTVAKHILRFVAIVVLVFLPLICHVSFQVYGVRWRRECEGLRRQIQVEQLNRRHLLAERARLRDPARLRREALRLALAPAPAGRAPIVVARGVDAEGDRR